MTSNGSGDGPSSTTVDGRRREDGPYILRSLLDNVPLSADGAQEDIKINCVDYFGEPFDIPLASLATNKAVADGNLYVGTSASELLHFVRIPPNPSDPSSGPEFILASRLVPVYAEPTTESRPGVQQILLLPRVGKACILCNSTVTFYSLPELSPVFGQTQVRNCNWIGGVDLNEPLYYDREEESGHGVAILLSLTRRIQVVRIAEDARVFRVC